MISPVMFDQTLLVWRRWFISRDWSHLKEEASWCRRRLIWELHQSSSLQRGFLSPSTTSSRVSAKPAVTKLSRKQISIITALEEISSLQAVLCLQETHWNFLPSQTISTGWISRLVQRTKAWVNSAGFSTPLIRDLFDSLYTCEPETFVFHLHTKKKKGGFDKPGDRKQNSPCKSSAVGEGQGAGQAMLWCLVRGCIWLRAWWHLLWEMTQHLLFPSTSTLMKEKLFPNLACLSHGAHWCAFAERRKLTMGLVLSYLPKPHRVSVLQNKVAPSARSASVNLPRVLLQ